MISFKIIMIRACCCKCSFTSETSWGRSSILSAGTLIGLHPHLFLMTAQLLINGRSTCSLCGKFLQVIPNIPFTTATAGKRARPTGNGLNIHTLFKQALYVVSFGATAMTHDLIFWAGRLLFHHMTVSLIGQILTLRN